MIRWVLVGLGVALGGVASAQNPNVIREVEDLLNALRPRPNPFGGVAVVQLPGQPRGGGQPPGGPPPGIVPPELNGDKPKPQHRIRTTGPTPGGPVKFDRNGDRLPAGAIARFGSVRLRHGSEPAGLLFSPDGKFLASVSATEDGIRLWDVTTGKEAGRLDATVTFAAFARDGHLLVVDDTRCKVWHPPTNAVRELPEGTLPEGTTALAVNPDSRSFAAAGPQKIVILDILTGKPKQELKVRVGQTADRMSYSPDGRWLAAVGPQTGGVWLWDLRTGKRVRSYAPGEPNQPCEFAFSPKSDRIAVATNQLRVYPLDSEEEVDGFQSPQEPLASPTYSNDGKFLFAQNAADGSVVRLDAATGEVKDTWESPDPENYRQPFALATEAALAAATDQSGGICIWNPESGEGREVARLTMLYDPGVSADGKTATCLDAVSRAHTFDPTTGAPGKVIRLPIDESTPVSWDARTRRAAAVVNIEDSLIHIIDADTGKVTCKFNAPANTGLPRVEFCPANRDRVAVFCPGSVAVVNVATGQVVRTIDIPQMQNQEGCFSPDGRLLAATGNTVGVWEVATGKKRFDLDALPNAQGVAFSPDGRLLAAWDNTDTVLIFDVRAGTTVRRFQLPGSDGSLSCAAFSPDGKRLVTGNQDGVVILWDVATADMLLVLDRHEGEVTGFAFTPDGSRLLSTASDGTALFWDLTVRAQPKAANPGVGGFDDAFRLLGSADAQTAQRGMEFLYRQPAEAVKQLAACVPVPPATPAARIAKLVVDLDSDDFPTRETAAKELEAIGGEAGAALRTAAEKSASAEVRKTASELAAKVSVQAAKPDDLRAVRAVEVAEHLGTPEARDLLKKWAAGPAGHRLTTEAAAAVARLK